MQNFKEAAKLSAEVKALTAEAEAAEEAAQKARDQLQAWSQRQLGSSHLEAAMDARKAAERAFAVARCSRLQVPGCQSADHQPGMRLLWYLIW